MTTRHLAQPNADEPGALGITKATMARIVEAQFLYGSKGARGVDELAPWYHDWTLQRARRSAR